MPFDCFVRKDGNPGKQIEGFQLTCIEDFSGISSIQFLIVTIYDNKYQHGSYAKFSSESNINPV
jgi:hypothetical protein